MINVTRQGDSDEYGIINFVADTRTDINDLPTSCKPGSNCIVIEDSSVWMLNSSGLWKELV